FGLGRESYSFLLWVNWWRMESVVGNIQLFLCQITRSHPKKKFRGSAGHVIVLVRYNLRNVKAIARLELKPALSSILWNAHMQPAFQNIQTFVATVDMRLRVLSG